MNSHLMFTVFLLGVVFAPLTACKSSHKDKQATQVVQIEIADDRAVSVARMWNEVLLEGIRHDFARPTVHARNLFHISIAMYDAWSAYSSSADTYLLGKTLAGYHCEFDPDALLGDKQIAREQALSYAVYRLIYARFWQSPGANVTLALADKLMLDLGYDKSITSRLYDNGSAIGLGNHIADCLINYGLLDGSNERIQYANVAYQSINPELVMAEPGNPNIVDLNHWQPLGLLSFIDQSGNAVTGGASEFLSPEWGQVTPFALSSEDAVLYERDNFTYWVYHDPGSPPLMDSDLQEYYQWNFTLVAKWSSHLSPADNVMMDISPASLGNITAYPTDVSEYSQFYNSDEGGDTGTGYDLNPISGAPYQPQWVPRGDYTRVLAEFWADGPNSETPPGHWFVILNSVIDHPLLEKKMQGVGPKLGSMEWDVKAYFALGGAMHDAAIAAWGIKGWYDYIRPVSAIRAMAELGQRSDPNLASYNPKGFLLEPDFIELVTAEDPLAGANGEHIGKIKLKAWRGPDYVDNPSTDTAGVAWILAENWWPYQRPSFVTPPFAGYISGHSTYSRAAAEVLTELTGSRFFPGGMSGFEIKADEFLVFEEGPSVNMTLEWATYQDASDQCSLSRIWGGIHPPVDDMPGRFIGAIIGKEAFALAKQYFNESQ